MLSLQSIRRAHANNMATFLRDPVAEISGSLGDLGTLLPLMIALAANYSISLSSTLVFSGIWNILTGVIFGIPLPVQPMKAIAAVAISQHYTIGETVSAGFLVAASVFLFSITGLLTWFTSAIPIPIIKGIQVGAGLSLIISASTNLLGPLHWTSPSWGDNLLWALLAFLALLACQSSRRFPYALVVFSLGLGLSFALTEKGRLPGLQIWRPWVMVPSREEFGRGALQAGLGQIPLTTLNSIIAVSALSADLLPHIEAPSATALAMSITGMNVIGGFFGAMPVCHGSGGLAAQYRFGARSGASIIILGVFKILLGLVFGETLVELLGMYPRGLLGVLVIASGWELGRVGESLNTGGARDLRKDESLADGGEGVVMRELDEKETGRRWMVMLITVGGLLAWKNAGVGFVAGMVTHWSYGLADVVEERWRERQEISQAGVEDEEEGLLAASG